MRQRLLGVAVGPVTGGTIDKENRFSNVGMIVFYDSTGRYRCSATLVTPTVLLTAAHCTDGTVGKTIVSFTPVIDEAPPSNLPRAADDPGTGKSATGYAPPTATLILELRPQLV